MAKTETPDIQTPVKYTKTMLELIKKKLSDTNFKHQNWGDDDLQEIRKHIRDHYREVQLGLCAYCKGELSLQSAANCHIEHIAPKSLYRDFMFEPKNLCVVCADCNEIKRNQEVMHKIPDTITEGENRKHYPRAKSAFLIVQPHYFEYDLNIDKFEGFYVDKTDEGHFTIGACVLNRRIRKFGWEKVYDDATVSAAANNYLAEKEPAKRWSALRTLKKLLIFN
jgi:5-methylcytosine-specific restriction endonuclease McrA